MEFIQFITENYRWLVTIIIALVTLFVTIFRKKVKVVDSVCEYIDRHLPSLINAAEELSSIGSTKKLYVIEWIRDALRQHFPNVDLDGYIDFINDSIEAILSTPQKKGN